MLKVTADTNIYISALNFGGIPLELLNLARTHVIRLDISDAILEETLGVLKRKFGWTEERLAEAEDRISRITARVNPTERLTIITEDEPDNRILECAKAAGSDFIVSGDHHLLGVGRFGKAPVVKVADFLTVVRREGPAL